MIGIFVFINRKQIDVRITIAVINRFGSVDFDFFGFRRLGRFFLDLGFFAHPRFTRLGNSRFAVASSVRHHPLPQGFKAAADKDHRCGKGQNYLFAAIVPALKRQSAGKVKGQQRQHKKNGCQNMPAVGKYIHSVKQAHKLPRQKQTNIASGLEFADKRLAQTQHNRKTYGSENECEKTPIRMNQLPQPHKIICPNQRSD